jgi:hypothetical protein
MFAPHVHRITKYDPADRDGRGAYRGAEDVSSDHGPVEAAYLAAVTAFAEDAGVTRLTIRDPAFSGFVHFGAEPPSDGHGLFPPDLTGYHDGARITLDVGRELVRAMLRGNGVWCRLESEDRFFVHVGYDQYLYIGSAHRSSSAPTPAGIGSPPTPRCPTSVRAPSCPCGRTCRPMFRPCCARCHRTSPAGSSWSTRTAAPAASTPTAMTGPV